MGQKSNLNPIVQNDYCDLAENMVQDKQSVLETRRGFTNYSSRLPSPATAIVGYQGRMVAQYSGGMSYDSDGAGTMASNSFVPTAFSDATTEFFESNQNLYFTDATGVYKMESYSGTPFLAGIKAPSSIQVSDSGVTAANLTINNNYAYRAIFCYTDSKNQLFQSAPSQRVVYNAGATPHSPTVKVYLPSTITTSNFVQIYRSNAFASSILPDDELSLCYEATVTSTDIANGYCSFQDDTPQALLGAALYCSPSQEGALQVNGVPPVSKCVAFWKGMAFYGNVNNGQYLNLSMIGVTGLSGASITINSSFGSETFTGAAAESIGSKQFGVYTTGTASLNIEQTAQSLCRVINLSTWATTASVYANYVSGADDVPGLIYFFTRNKSYGSFWLTCSASAFGNNFRKVIPTSGTSLSSISDVQANRLYISKVDQTEAVPPTNYIDVGQSGKSIIAIRTLRDSVMIFLSNGGLYRCYGTDPSNISLVLFDQTLNLVAGKAASNIAGAIYALTTKGVNKITESGVSLISGDINDQLLKVIANSASKTYSFSIGYESDKRYLLFTTVNSASGCDYCFVWNDQFDTWTTWNIQKNCGCVEPISDKLFLGGDRYIQRERKDRSSLDYLDEGISITITSAGTASSLTPPATQTLSISFNALDVPPKAGDYIVQNSIASIISSVPSSWTVAGANLTGDIVVSITQSVSPGTLWGNGITWGNGTIWGNGTMYIAGSATTNKTIQSLVTTSNMHFQAPHIVKQFREMEWMFDDMDSQTLTVGMRTNFSPAFETQSITPVNYGTTWGNGTLWGSPTAWANSYPIQELRLYSPTEKQWGHWMQGQISGSTPFKKVSILGFSVTYQGMSEVFT